MLLFLAYSFYDPICWKNLVTCQGVYGSWCPGAGITGKCFVLRQLSPKALWLLKPSLHHQPAYVNRRVLNMAAALPRGFSTAYKRARSQDSLTPLASPPVLKATKLEDEAAQDESRLPGFLRQSQHGKLLAVGAVREHA